MVVVKSLRFTLCIISATEVDVLPKDCDVNYNMASELLWMF